jgi:MFS transporter, ACS family, tartrate transporter
MNLQDVNPTISARLMRKICWRLVPLMVVMYLISSLDRANIGYAALMMNKDLGMTTADFGIAAGLFYLGYILFQTPSNLALHRIGARVWIALILVAWGGMSSLTCIVPDAHWLYVARFFLGIFEAGLFPGMVLYLTLWLPSRNRVWVMSMFVTAMPLAAVVGAPISTALMSHISILGLNGWRTMLLLEGLPAVLMGIFVFFYLPGSPHEADWMAASELRELEDALDIERRRNNLGTSDLSIRNAMTSPRVWMLGVVYFGINAGIVILLYFLPQVIKTFEVTYGVKYSVFDVGMISAVPFGFAVVCMLLWGRFVTRRSIAAWHVACPLAICAVSIGIALSLPSPIQVMIAFAIAAATCFSTMSPFWQLPSRFLSGKAAAAGIGMISSLGVASGCVLPYVIGWVKDKSGSFAPAFLGISGIMLFAAITVLALEMRTAPGKAAGLRSEA